ncbi:MULTISPECIES: hypothetical protein [unclassified Klebsiella]|uniref:hypothetical protein n=1 Tax=unclassified Klebsiella TaxID=2608929 RepID=UPI0014193D38|nr:hypothetical protein [Klebsiella sp. Ap-874]NIG47618.1 hypothetical protein [Klebsiella sp. Ap-874]NIG72851.1 hypothetical protein [Klebsiella sp. Ap-873]
MKSYNAIITMNGKQYRISTHNGLGGVCRCITTDRLITSDATWKKILKVWAEEAHAEALEVEEALIVSTSSEDVQTTEALTTEELRMKNISVPASQMEVGKAYKIAGFNTNRAFIKIDAEQAEAISTIFPGVDDTLMILDLSSGEVTHISSDVAMCECASYQTEEEQA